MRCKILGMERKSFNSDLKQVLIGTITLEGKKLSSKAEKGNELEMKNVMASRRDEEPAKWFKRLPEIYDGVALRAEIVKD